MLYNPLSRSLGQMLECSVFDSRPKWRKSMKTSRRALLAGSLGLGGSLLSWTTAAAQQPPAPRNRLAVSTYSFWQFNRRDLRDIEKCIDLSAEWGFDGVELLHRQMESEDKGYLQRLKRRAFINGLDLCGFSTHQGFLSPDETTRQKNIDHTIHCIELAYDLGIPTMRVNTGTW